MFYFYKKKKEEGFSWVKTQKLMVKKRRRTQFVAIWVELHMLRKKPDDILLFSSSFLFQKCDSTWNWTSPGQQLEDLAIRRVLNNIFYQWFNQNLCFEHPLFSLSFFQKIMFYVFFFVVEAKMTFHHQIQKEDISKNNLKNDWNKINKQNKL